MADETSSSSQEASAPAPAPAPPAPEPSERERILDGYRAKILQHRETEARLKKMRDDNKDLVKRYQKTEDDLTALQSVGQIIGDVLKQLDTERFIVKASSGPRYVVGCRSRLNHDKLKPGTRVALDMTTLTIMRILPREVDPTVFHMQSSEEDGGVSYSDIGGLNEQIRELREVIELPLTNPELFVRVGIKVRYDKCYFSLVELNWIEFMHIYLFEREELLYSYHVNKFIWKLYLTKHFEYPYPDNDIIIIKQSPSLRFDRHQKVFSSTDPLEPGKHSSHEP